MFTAQDLASQDAAYAKNANDEQVAANAQQTLKPAQPGGIMQWMQQMPRRISLDMIDGAVHAADTFSGLVGDTYRAGKAVGAVGDEVANAAGRAGQDIAAGAAKGYANVIDAAHSAADTLGEGYAGATQGAAVGVVPGAEQNAEAARKATSAQLPLSPIFDHARNAVMDFRDAVAVKDPTLADNLTQSVAQLAIPFMGYSRVLSGLHGFADAVTSGALTDSTALSPHAMRFADLIQLGRHTEGKLGAALRALAPDGSAQEAYLRYLTDRKNETEAEGRFKNVLDGFGANLVVTPLLGAAASVLKQGPEAIGRLIDYGLTNAGELGPVGRAAQEGKIVFHGTPHDFDEFDSSKIGTGEGNQTFGHGLYFAENPDTADYYRKMLTKVESSPFGGNNPNAGSLMHVDIPDEHIDNMIDWDAPISEQPRVQKALSDLDLRVEPHGDRYRVMVNGKPGPQYLTRQAAMSETDLLRGESPGTSAGMAYNQLAEALRSPKAASDYLAAKGIPGVKYLDQGSRDSRIVVDGKQFVPKGYAEEGAAHLVQQQKGLGGALRVAEKLGWDKPNAFYQDREKYAVLKQLEAKKAEYGTRGGTRNIVLFDHKLARIVEKH